MSRRPPPTSQDVADRAGVSRTVVSFVLNNRPHTGISDETRHRVLRAAAELDYRPNRAARNLVSGLTHTLGVVVSETRQDAYGDAFLPSLLRGVDDAARTAGYRILIDYLDDRDNARLSLAMVRERAIDGVIVCGPDPDRQVLGLLVEEGIPSVVVGDPGSYACPSVDIDNVGAARTAVAHLVAHGYRRVGMISNVPFRFPSAQSRRQGFLEALHAAGIEGDDRLIVEGELDDGSGRQAMEKLLHLAPRPEAVFAASDQVAFGALAAVHAAGLRVPDDLALVGFDNLPLAAHSHPALSTVQVPAVDLGRTAGECLLGLVDHREPELTRVILPTKLVVRDSCGEHPRPEMIRNEGGI